MAKKDSPFGVVPKDPASRRKWLARVAERVVRQGDVVGVGRVVMHFGSEPVTAQQGDAMDVATHKIAEMVGIKIPLPGVPMSAS